MAHTVTAKWTTIKYNVTFDANGGTFDATSITTYMIIIGPKLTINATATFEHCTFPGRFTERTDGTKFVSDIGSLPNLSVQDMALSDGIPSPMPEEGLLRVLRHKI